MGYTLDELPNYITSKKGEDGNGSLYTSACFEPTIDYCVIKIPRWTFEKFPDADETLTTQMKSVGEAMAIGRTFKEALQKGIRSMEVKRFGFGLDQYDKWLNAAKAGTEALKPGQARRHGGRNIGQDHAGGKPGSGMAHPGRKAAAKTGRAEPGAAVLHPVCDEVGMEHRSDL